MSGSTSNLSAASTAAQTQMTQDSTDMITQQAAMFHTSTMVNMAESQLQTWGNLAESAAKNKPQV